MSDITITIVIITIIIMMMIIITIIYIIIIIMIIIIITIISNMNDTNAAHCIFVTFSIIICSYLVASLQASDIGLLLAQPFGPMGAGALSHPVPRHEYARQAGTGGRHACMRARGKGSYSSSKPTLKAGSFFASQSCAHVSRFNSHW